MQYLAWPGAFLIFALVFIFVFKKSITSLFMRVQKISKEGIQTGDVTQIQENTDKKSSAEELMRAFDSVVLLEGETLIKKDLEKRELNDKEAIDILSRHLAATQLALRFEGIYSSIWGSQINLLKHLNSKAPLGDTVENIKSGYYDVAAMFYPDVYKSYSFDAYLYFLTSLTLIIKTDRGYGITNLGRDFLIYLVQTGKSESRLY
jgi:hypothetical protein